MLLLNIAGAVPQIDLFEMTDEQWRAGAELKGARDEALWFKQGRHQPAD